MRRSAFVGLAALAVVCAVGSVANAAGTGWHSARLSSLGKGLGTLSGSAVGPLGTSVVVFTSKSALTVARRTVRGSKFTITGRLSVSEPSVSDLTALANGHFLLVYTTGQELVAADVGTTGRFVGTPHVLAATGYEIPPSGGWTGTDFLAPFRDAVVDSDASRAVVVWGPVGTTTERIEGAVYDEQGWSEPKVFYSHAWSGQPAFYNAQIAHDARDRFLVSAHGLNGDTTAVMWGLRGGSQRWEKVTPPQAAGKSKLGAELGATVDSAAGTITAAWQYGSGTLVVSTWNGSRWAKARPVIAGSRIDGQPVPLFPVFVSDGSREAIVWCDNSHRFPGTVDATIRAGSGKSWSAPLVFRHSICTFQVGPPTSTDTFWFTSAGALAGVYNGDPQRNGSVWAGLYVGRVGAGKAASTALTRAQYYNGGEQDRAWFALPRADGRTTVVWANGKGREFSTTTQPDGTAGKAQPLPACGYPFFGASDPVASTRLLTLTPEPFGATGGSAAKACPARLLW